MARRGTTTQRGYGKAHQDLREQWRPHVDAGKVACWRCHQPIQPGTPWHLGHDDHDRTRYRGPEHDTCNLGTKKTREPVTPAIDPPAHLDPKWDVT